MHSKINRATALFGNGFNCAQSVVGVFCEQYNVDAETALKISSGMGGGFRCGEICGAVSGAVLVIGLKYGRYLAEDSTSKEICNGKVVEFTRLFKEQNQSLVCREILHADLSTEEGFAQAKSQNLFKTTCVNMIKSAVTLLEELGY